jgi:3-oxoadipate enol-lactonase
MRRPELVSRLIVEDAPPAMERELVIPERPAEPVDFDWAVVPAMLTLLSQGDPAAWAGLGSIEAPTLIVGGGPASHVPQELLAQAAARIPDCELITIEAGHNVHAARPAEFAQAVLRWLDTSSSGRSRA